PFLVQVLHFHVDDVGGFDRLTRAESPLDGAAGFEIADFDAVERLALAGLDELVVDHGVRLRIEQQFHARTNLACSVTGHFFLTAWAAKCAPPKRAAYDNGIPPPPPARPRNPRFVPRKPTEELASG